MSFTAPTVNANTEIKVRAQANADPTSAAVVTVTIIPRIPNPLAVLETISPSSFEVQTSGNPPTLTVRGQGFLSTSVVRWNNQDRATSFINDTQLGVTLQASDVNVAGKAQVSVFNPAPGGGVSNTLEVSITTNPKAVLSKVSPNALALGGVDGTLQVDGTGFIPGSVLRWNGLDRSTGFISATKLNATVTGDDLKTSGTARVSVFNPSPGGGISNVLEVQVIAFNPSPIIAGLTPNSLVAGSAESSITVNGSQFVSGSEVHWNGQPRPTRFVDDHALTVRIPATDLLKTGIAKITVVTPTPGGGTSSSQDVMITGGAPVPRLDSNYPFRAFVGESGFTMNVYGSDFSRNAVLRWNGSDRPTTFVGSSQLQAEIGADDLKVAQHAQVTIFNPAPGGGTSQAIPYYVEAFKTLPLQARDLIFDASRTLLYATVGSFNATHGNQVVVIDPNSGQVIDGIVVGNEPNKLALSDDAKYLYVTLNTASEVLRIDLATRTIGQLGSPLPGGPYNDPYVADQLIVLPGQSKVLAMSLQRMGYGNGYGNVVIYDDGVARSNRVDGGLGGVTFLTRSAQNNLIYAVRYAYPENPKFLRISLDASGVTLSSSVNDLFAADVRQVIFDAGRVYGADGSFAMESSSSVVRDRTRWRTMPATTVRISSQAPRFKFSMVISHLCYKPQAFKCHNRQGRSCRAAWCVGGTTVWRT
jgi:hypothetical protein